MCGQTEHTHTDACYPSNQANQSADPQQSEEEVNQPAREDAAAWEATFVDVTAQQDLTIAEKTAAIARTQLGYAESTEDVQESGDDAQGATRYGIWYNTAKSASDSADYAYAAWDGTFAAFCLSYGGADIEDMQFKAVVDDWMLALTQQDNASVQYPTDYDPKVGDVVFAAVQRDGSTVNTAGIVTAIDDDVLTVAVGDEPEGDADVVKEITLSTYDDAVTFYLEIPGDEASQPVAAEDDDEAVQDDAHEVVDGVDVQDDIESTDDNMATGGDVDGAAHAWTTTTGDLLSYRLLSNDFATPLTSRTPAATTYAEGDTTAASDGLDVAQQKYMSGATDGIVVKWHEYHDTSEPTTPEWKPLPGEGEDPIPSNAHLRFEVTYSGVDPQDLANAGYELYINPNGQLKNLTATGKILVGGEPKGIIEATEDMVVLKFDEEWVNSIIESNKSETTETHRQSIAGTFYYQGELFLDKVPDSGGTELTLGPVTITIPTDGDAVARYGDLTVEKSAAEKLVQGTDGVWYLDYTLTVTAGEYGAPSVSVRDAFTAGSDYVERYVGVKGTPTTPVINGSSATAPESGPIEWSTVTPYGAEQYGQVYLTNDKGAATANGTFTPATDGSSLAWQIGDMQANEVRTLRYRVQVTDEYVGIVHTANTLVNQANLYSKNYPHKNAVSDYTPTVKGTSTKGCSEPYTVAGDGGAVYVDYTVQITADASNSYPLRNANVRDILSSSASSDYLSYVQDSVKVYKDANKTVQVSAEELSGFRPSGNPVFESGPAFTVYVGDLAPGESRWITYTARIAAEDAQLHTNGAVTLKNTAHFRVATETGADSTLKQSTTTTTVSNQRWDRKLSGGLVDTDLTIAGTAEQKAYDATVSVEGDAPLNSRETPISFTVPAGSYQYSVVLNEKATANGWDVTSATWSDTIDANEEAHQQYVGYVRVDEYAEPLSVSDNTQTALEKALEGRDPDNTVWVWVDGQTNFSFKGSQIDLSGENAYVLTYYTQQRGSGFGIVSSTNSFNLSGEVGVGEQKYELVVSPVTVTTTVQEQGTASLQKQSWYYSAEDTFKGALLDTGVLYWVVEIEGNKIPSGLHIQERTGQSYTEGHNTTYQKSRGKNSFIGLYTLNAIQDDAGVDIAFADRFASLSDFYAAVADGTATKMSAEDHYTLLDGNLRNKNETAEYGEERDVEVVFKQDYTIPTGQKVYMLVCTEPKILPLDSQYTKYENAVHYSVDEETWYHTYASQTVTAPHSTLDKSNDGVFTVSTGADGTKTYKVYDTDEHVFVEASTTKATDTLQTKFLCVGGSNDGADVFKRIDSSDQSTSTYEYDDGTYVVWNLSINNAGTMAGGTYTITDTLPDGVEVAYARASWANSALLSAFHGDNWTGKNEEPENIIATGSKDLLSKGWSEYRTMSTLVNYQLYWNRIGTYYYTQGNQVKLNVTVPENATNATGNHHFEFQIVCRVTDPNLLKEDITLTNTASVTNEADQVVEEDSDTTTVFTSNVTKEMLAEITDGDGDGVGDTLQSAVIPYEITLNEEKQDLDPSGDVISVPLVDHSSANLRMSMDTLEIFWETEDPDNQGQYIDELIYTGATGNKTGATIIRTSVEQYRDEEGNADGSQVVKFYNLPDNRKLVIKYKMSATLSTTGSDNTLSNNAYWEGSKGADGGSTQKSNMVFKAGAITRTDEHGAVKVTKRAADDTSKTLEGAEFTLYNAVVPESGDATLGDSIATGSTDKYGVASYGLSSDQSEIKFDTVYCVKETKAPSGYDLDTTEYYFVFPSTPDSIWPSNVYVCSRTEGNTPTFFLDVLDYKGSAQVTKAFGGSSATPLAGFYTFGIWPASAVSEVTGPTGDPSNTQTITYTSSGTDPDIGWYTGSGADAVWYRQVTDGTGSVAWQKFDGASWVASEEAPADAKQGILPGHQKTATFDDLTYGESYYIFELNDAGYPVIDGVVGTFNNMQYQVSYTQGGTTGNAACKVTPTRDDASGETTIPVVTASNDQYEARAVKSFKDASGGALGVGIAGTYTFGIQKNYNGTWERVLETQTITWAEGDTDASKTAVFTGLEPGATYRIVELDAANGNAVLGGGASFTVDGSVYIVGYTDNEFTVGPDEVPVAQVTNQSTANLPLTGGMGTTPFVVGGIILAAIGLAGLVFRRRKPGKGLMR